jgi:hypothetical protein
MNLKIFQETKPVSGSNWLVAAVYDPDAPLIVVAQYAFPKPYTGQTQAVNFNGLDDIVYTYICWESTTTSPGGTSRNNFEIQPSNNAFNVREDLFLEADISPYFASGTNFYGPDSSLIGWDWYFERIPLGTQQPDVDYSKTIAGVATDISNTASDGFKLLAPGDVFGMNEKAVIHFYPQVAASPSAPTAKLISSTIILTSNTILDNTALGKSYLLQGSGGYFDVTLPDLSSISDNKPIFFLSSGGSHINVGIKCFGSQLFQWSGGSTSKLILAQNEQMMVYKLTYPDASQRWLVAQISDTVRMVGEIVLSYTKTEQNTLFLDGNQSLSRTNYARLWNFVNAMDADSRVTGAAWSHTFGPLDGVTYYDNKGKFSEGDGSTTFGLPLAFLYGFFRLVQGATSANKPGRLEVGTMFDHSHPTLTGTIPGAPNGLSPSGTNGGYNGLHTSKSDLSGPAFNRPGAGNDGSVLVRVGSEVRPDNIGIYASIRF